MDDEVQYLHSRYQQLQSYLKEDPSVIFYEQEWAAIADRALQHWQTLQQQKQSLALSKKANVAAARKNIERLQAELSPYLLAHYEFILDFIATHPDQRQPLIQQLRSDPLFLLYQQRDADLKQQYEMYTKQSNKHCIDERVQSIYRRSRYLFLKLPRSEMLTTKTSACPHFKSITEFFNQINLYVVDDILRYDSINNRIAAFSHWIGVLQGLYDVGDISSCFSIHAALTSNLALQRLTQMLSGLSNVHQQQLKTLGEQLKMNRMATLAKERQDHIVPFLGYYRQQLERIKANSNRDHSAEAKASCEKSFDTVADQVECFKNALQPNGINQAYPSPIGRWVKDNLNQNNAVRCLQKQHFQRAKQYAPRDDKTLASRLSFQTQQCWLNQLFHQDLARAIVSQKKIPVVVPSTAAVQMLNEMTQKKVSYKEFKNSLSSVGILLDDEAVLLALYQKQNQMVYHGLIKNRALKRCVREMSLYHKGRFTSTSGVIKKINKMLATLHPIGYTKMKTLQKTLKSIGVVLTQDELLSVIREEQQRVIKLSKRQTVSDVTAQLSALLIEVGQDDVMRQQMEDYLKLIATESLSQCDKKRLAENLTSVLPGNGMRHSGFNPFLKKLEKCVQITAHLNQLVKQGKVGQLTQSEFRAIKVLRKKVRNHRLFKIKSLLNRWVDSQMTPDPSLRLAVKRALGTWSYYRLNRSSHRQSMSASSERIQVVRTRSRTRLQPQVNRRLRDYFQQYVSSENQFLKTLGQPVFNLVNLRAFQVMKNKLQKINSIDDLDTVKKEFKRQTPHLHTAIEQVKQSYQQHRKLKGDVVKEFKLCSDLLGYVDPSEPEKFSHEFKMALHSAQFSQKTRRRYPENLAQLQLDSFQSYFPNASPLVLQFLSQADTLQAQFTLRHQQLLDAMPVAPPTVKPMISQQMRLSPPLDPAEKISHPYLSATFKYGAATIGAVVLAPIAIKMASLAMVGSLFHYAFAAKVTAGVVAAGAGAKFAMNTEQAVEKNWSDRLGYFGLFGHKPMATRVEQSNMQAHRGSFSA